MRVLRPICALMLAAAPAQTPYAIRTTDHVEPGKFLIASRSSHDVDFAQTIILLLHSDEHGAYGLIVNQPSNVPVASIFPDLKTGPVMRAPVYKGGPLRRGVNALLRSRTKPESASAVFGDVYVIADKSTIGKVVAAGAPARVYVGLCGWSPAGQLINEVQRGLWFVADADAGTVFEPNPVSAWPRLVAKMEKQ
jgi:putative transcriptional regulator